MKKYNSAFFNNGLPIFGKEPVSYVYAGNRMERIAALTNLHPRIVGETNFHKEAPLLENLDVIFSTWGMPALTGEHIDQLPQLKALFYAAGSVKQIAEPFLERNITLVSARAANAASVAEFCLGQIILACKGYFRNSLECRERHCNHFSADPYGPGLYGESIALIGAGEIGRALIQLLKPFRVRVLVVDPFITDEETALLNVQCVSMEEAFEQAFVVSNHLPNLPHLAKVLDARLFSAMRPFATFINTGRGRQVDEEGLLATLKRRTDLMALLDVTDPEPAAPDSDLYRLPNVRLSSHMAGAHGDEVLRMSDTIMEEFLRWQDGKPLRHQITMDMLAVMA